MPSVRDQNVYLSVGFDCLFDDIVQSLLTCCHIELEGCGTSVFQMLQSLDRRTSCSDDAITVLQNLLDESFS